jgi:hypothetical protein
LGHHPNKKGRGYEPRPWGFTGYLPTIRISSSLPQPALEECLRVAVIERSKGSLFVFHKEGVFSKSYQHMSRINLITNPCQATFFFIFSRRNNVSVSPSLASFHRREELRELFPQATFILDIISVHRYIFSFFTYYFGLIIFTLLK